MENIKVVLVKVAALVLMAIIMVAEANELKVGYYGNRCENLYEIVREGVREAVANKKRMAASLLRLHFHDCFVNGCDASLLLDDKDGFKGEKTAGPNDNSVRGFEVIDCIKAKVEAHCPATVSCADILTLVARDSVVALGGPSWKVPLGRRDSTTASLSAAANKNLPGPGSDMNTLLSRFAAQGLSKQDLIALSGAHTIGKARCVTFRSRIYNATAPLDARFADAVKRRCPAQADDGDDNLRRLDAQTPAVFDNRYYVNLLHRRGLLNSDQVIAEEQLVMEYSSNTDAFFRDFKEAMLRMGNISPLTGTSGQIRLNCRVVN